MLRLIPKGWIIGIVAGLLLAMAASTWLSYRHAEAQAQEVTRLEGVIADKDRQIADARAAVATAVREAERREKEMRDMDRILAQRQDADRERRTTIDALKNEIRRLRDAPVRLDCDVSTAVVPDSVYDRLRAADAAARGRREEGPDRSPGEPDRPVPVPAVPREGLDAGRGGPRTADRLTL